MSLNPIGYVVKIHVTDDMCLYFTHLTRGGLELTADLDKAMLFDTVERARDFAFHASYILQVDENVSLRQSWMSRGNDSDNYGASGF